MKKEHSSRPRNPIIANACFLGGYIDTWGRGTLKIINSCLEAGLPEAEIKERNGGVSIALFNHSKAAMADGAPKTTENTVNKIIGEKVGEKVGEKITKNQRMILDSLSQNPHASAKWMITLTEGKHHETRRVKSPAESPASGVGRCCLERRSR